MRWFLLFDDPVKNGIAANNLVSSACAAILDSILNNMSAVYMVNRSRPGLPMDPVVHHLDSVAL